MSNAIRMVLIFLTVCCFQPVVYSQQSGKDVIIEHADSLVGLEINGEQARQLIGNVRFSQGNIVVTCQRAIQYRTSNKVEMEGVVEVRDDSMRMVGSRGVYYANTRTAEAFDRVMLEEKVTTLHAGYGKYFINEKKAYFTTKVIVQDTGAVLTCDELTYFRDQQYLIADGHVTILGDEDNLTTYGNHFENYKAKSYSVMTGNPHVVQIDTSADGKADTLQIFSKTMEMYQDSVPRLIATDSVRIYRSEMSAEAGHAVFFTKQDSIILRRQPFVWYSTGTNDANQVSGDSIFVTLERQKLKKVYIRGRAVAISRADSSYAKRFNQMTGQEIVMHFEESKPVQMEVDRTATSLYYLFDKQKPNGLNKSTGDRIVMTFDEGKIENIKVLSGVQGQYFPEKLVKGKEEQYTLEGFNWKEEDKSKVKSQK